MPEIRGGFVAYGYQAGCEFACLKSGRLLSPMDTGKPPHGSRNQSINWLTAELVGRLIGELVSWLTGSPTKWLAG